MARMIFMTPFLQEMSTLDPRVEAAIWRKLAAVEQFPGVGTALVEPSLRRVYGDRCLKVSASGYNVIYERIAENDGVEVIHVHDIVHQRRVR